MEIQVLDERTIDKIAAGEVVDRPASVVKELVENAMDSGADAVTVEIREGGISLIRVTDNGKGIPKAEVARAFLRHATSKIRGVEDLLHLSSLGFRGEALSSICAVAQVELITKTPQELTGLRYVIEGSHEKAAEEIGAPTGTTVLVRNLFYNVPARRKFLKSPQSEGGHISELMEHLALSHPDISFKYVINGQVRFHTSGNDDLKEIIYRIYGRDIAKELLWLEKEEAGKRISGFIGTPSIGRANRNFENYYINGRFIKSPIIAKAAEEAYKAWLMQHKYPFFVLHLGLSPEEMDVNVHPSKMEVRFHEAAAVSDFVYEAIHDTLSGREMLKEITFDQKEQKAADAALRQAAAKEHVPEPFEIKARQLIEQGMAESTETQAEEKVQPEEAMQVQTDIKRMEAPSQAINVQAEASEMPRKQLAEEAVYGRLLGGADTSKGTETEKLRSNVIKKEEHILVERPVQMNFFEEKLISQKLRDEYQLLGQVFDTYWIVCFRDKLFFIDQHAAHEKVKYERLYKQIRERSISSQQISPPVILTLSGSEEKVYTEYAAYFEKMGFEIEPFGGNEYAVRSVPTDLFGHHIKELLEEMLDELAEGPIKGEPEAITSRLASMSCKAAVKGNHAMSHQEAEALIDELLTLDNPYHCPHGRPTIITMTKYELEKKFSRIV